MPREPASRRRTVAERTDLAELREARRPRLSAPRAAAPAPKSPASDIGDMASDASGDKSGSEASASGIGPAPPRARGRGRAGDGDGGGAHGDAAGAAPGGRGRGRRARGALAAPPVPRGSRQVRWGKPEWSYVETVNGLGADCRCHTNAVDIPGITTHCKKNMPYSIRHPVTASEGRRLCKVWLICGLETDDGDMERSDHVAINPRDHRQDWSEADLDAFVATL